MSELIRYRLNGTDNRIFFVPNLNVRRLVLPIVASVLVLQCTQPVRKVIEGAHRICGPRAIYNPIIWTRIWVLAFWPQTIGSVAQSCLSSGADAALCGGPAGPVN